MRWRALAAAAALALAAVVLTRGAGPELETPGTSLRPEPHVAGSAPALTNELQRNPFEYADPPVTAGEERARPAPAPRPEAVTSGDAAEPVRLVGFLRRGGELRAVLSVDGDVLLAAMGETVAGCRVLAVDEEAGVRLLTPDGVERQLSPP